MFVLTWVLVILAIILTVAYPIVSAITKRSRSKRVVPQENDFNEMKGKGV